MELQKKLNFEEFPLPSYNDWKEEAIKSLKGGDFDKKLLTETFENIILKPIYNLSDLSENSLAEFNPGEFPFSRGANSAGYKHKKWEIAQVIPYNSPADFNNALKADLNAGQNAINVHLNRNDHICYLENSVECGLHLRSLEDFEIALDGIDLTAFPIYYNSGDFFFEFADLFLEFINKKGFDKSKITGHLGVDFFGETLVNGGSAHSLEKHYKNLIQVFNTFSKELPNFGIININSSIFHNSGANAVQELAYGFAQAIELISNLTERGIDLNLLLSKIKFSLAVSSNFFMEIAKLRAARLIWSVITNEFGANAEQSKMKMHCSTSLRNKTKYDPWVNLLRNSIETLAAILGNANSIEVGNFDFAYGMPSDFSRRISRNTQLVLAHEAHLFDTIDPTAGSYYIENLNKEIIENTWKLIQDIESQSGFSSCIESGFIQNSISQQAEKQVKSYTSRRSTLLGTNKYPNLNEKQPNGNQEYSFKHRSQSELTKMEYIIPQLKIVRFSSLFEKLRNNAESYSIRNGESPQIILMNFGELNEWKPRNDFASDFLQVGGFELINSPVFKDAIEAIDYKPDGPHSNIFAICSSDATYEELLPSLLPAIKEQVKNAYFILAGFPEGKIEEYKSLGINEFIHLKANLYDTLEKIQTTNQIQ
jgi:methylmalonyl-CoA mutase